MTLCRSVEEVRAAAHKEHDGPLTQEQANLVAAILAPYLDQFGQFRPTTGEGAWSHQVDSR